MTVSSSTPLHPAVALFERTRSIGDFPSGMEAVPDQMDGTAFFPGGLGLWCGGDPGRSPIFPLRGVMVVGQDFGTRVGYERSKANKGEDLNGPTWRNLKAFLDAVPVPLPTCFFTNVFMGLRSRAPIVGPCPGWRLPGFLAECRAYFLEQIRAQRPRLVVTLGSHVPRFLAPLSEDLREWRQASTLAQLDFSDTAVVPNVSFIPDHSCVIAAITHPSLRPANVWRRSWRGHHDSEAELALVRYAFAESTQLRPDTTA